MIFGDFRQAYGCVLRENLQTELLTYGITVKIIVNKNHDKIHVQILWSQDKG